MLDAIFRKDHRFPSFGGLDPADSAENPKGTHITHVDNPWFMKNTIYTICEAIRGFSTSTLVYRMIKVLACNPIKL